MTDIHFYHMTRASLEDVLPELLEKTLGRGWKAVVMAGSPERVENLTQHLWTYKPDRFLPHGSMNDGNAEYQPVWLTADDERPNAAHVLFLTDGAKTERHADYERVCELFDGNDPTRLDEARARWAGYKTSGHTLTYWQQGENGWQKAG